MFFQQHVQTASVLTLGSNFHDVVGVMIMIRNEKHDDSIICTEAVTECSIASFARKI